MHCATKRLFHSCNQSHEIWQGFKIKKKKKDCRIQMSYHLKNWRYIRPYYPTSDKEVAVKWKWTSAYFLKEKTYSF